MLVPEHKALICVECESAVHATADGIRDHIKTHGSVRQTPRWRTAIEAFIQDQGIPPQPAHPTGQVQPVPFLSSPIRNFVVCQACHRGYQNENSLKRHQCNSQSALRWYESAVQRFQKNSKSPWFPVHVPPLPQPQSNERTPWEAYIQQRTAVTTEDGLLEAIPHDHRVLHGFLTRRKWLQHIEHVPMDDIENLKMKPRADDPLACISYHLQHYLKTAPPDFFAISRLIGQRPSVENESVSYSCHGSVQPDTLRKYAGVVASAIVLLIRTVDTPVASYPFTVPDEIQTNAILLYEDLKKHSRGKATSEVSIPVQERLVSLLRLLYVQKPDINQGHFASPLYRYLVLSSVDKDKTWHSASTITQRISAMTFVGRSVLAGLIQEQAQSTTEELVK